MNLCLIVFTLLLNSLGSHQLEYALFTAGPTGGFDSSGAVPAIELAEEMINADSSILPGYNLTHTTVYDTMVSYSINSLFPMAMHNIISYILMITIILCTKSYTSILN